MAWQAKPISSIPLKWLQSTSNHHTSRFEVEPTCPFRDGISKDFNISSNKKEELRGSPSLVGRGIANPVLQLVNVNKRNKRQIICYARKYGFILDTGDASILTSLSGPQRRHVMEALTVLSKSTGCYDKWYDIRKRYQLHWTNGNESIAAMQRFFDSNLTLDSMVSKIKEMIRVLPVDMSTVIRFACITGLRPNEACESVRLICLPQNSGANYYNSETQTLEHFRFPDIFLRPTKKAYLSYLSTDNYHYFSNIGSKAPTLKAISSACKRRNKSMSMHLCRKVFASWLRQKGIEPEIVDLLQGRVSQSVLTRHYLAPSHDLKTRVLDAVAELQKNI